MRNPPKVESDPERDCAELLAHARRLREIADSLYQQADKFDAQIEQLRGGRETGAGESFDSEGESGPATGTLRRV